MGGYFNSLFHHQVAVQYPLEGEVPLWKGTLILVFTIRWLYSTCRRGRYLCGRVLGEAVEATCCGYSEDVHRDMCVCHPNVSCPAREVSRHKLRGNQQWLQRH